MNDVIYVCFSRCLYCGRRTPHEVCSHSTIGTLPDECHRDPDLGYTNFDAPAEECPEGCDLDD